MQVYNSMSFRRFINYKNIKINEFILFYVYTIIFLCKHNIVYIFLIRCILVFYYIFRILMIVYYILLIKN